MSASRLRHLVGYLRYYAGARTGWRLSRADAKYVAGCNVTSGHIAQLLSDIQLGSTYLETKETISPAAGRTGLKVAQILQLLGVIWSVVAFVIVAVFFMGGEWQRWTEVKKRTLDASAFDRPGIEIANDQLFRIRGNLEVDGNRWDGEPATVRVGGGAKSCPEGWFVVGMRGVDTDGGDYCGDCISQIEFVCRKL
jgi:hypothetical protein